MNMTDSERMLAARVGALQDAEGLILALCAAPRGYPAAEAVAYTLGRLRARIEALEGRLAVAEDQLRASREAP
jgi:hypothetical protein